MIREGLQLNLPASGELEMFQLASVTVTFNPDIMLLEQQLRATSALRVSIVIDNGSTTSVADAIELLVGAMPWVRLIRSGRNYGLAAALNLGVREASRQCPAVGAVLLLDQDSLFDSDTPRGLLESLNAVQAATGRLCCVGPMLRDPDNGMMHGFHYIAGGWRWARAYPSESAAPFEVRTLNGSGTMMSLQLLNILGGLEEDFFIDHIDTEWSFRVTSQGGKLYGIPSLAFDHRMGEVGRRIWLLGWRIWPERSPLRHYYLFRNTVRLLRRSYIPLTWKAWAVLKLMVTFVTTFIIDTRRAEQMRQMFRGICGGTRS